MKENLPKEATAEELILKELVGENELTEAEKLKEELLQNLAKADILSLEQDKDGIFFVKGLDEFEEMYKKSLELIEDAEFTAEDRSTLRSMKAAIASYLADVNSDLAFERERVFGKADSQRAQIAESLSKLSRTVKEKIDEAAKLAKEEKFNYFVSQLEIYKRYNAEAENISINDVIETSWTNLSASQNKNREEMIRRLDSAVKISKSTLCKSDDAREILLVLARKNWSEADAMEFLNSMYSTEEEKAADNEKEITEENDEKMILSVEISRIDYTRILGVLRSSGLKFKVLK